MDPELLVIFGFSFLTTVAVIAAIGGIILLRPISKQLGHYLQTKADQGKLLQGRSPEDLDRLLSVMEGVADRLDRLEERQEFTENLLSRPREEGSGS